MARRVARPGLPTFGAAVNRAPAADMVTISRPPRLVQGGGCGDAALSGALSFDMARPVELGRFEHCGGGGAPTFGVGTCVSAGNRC